MKDFKYEVQFIRTETVETIAGFNNPYIAQIFYEGFVKKAYSENWGKWKMELVDTRSNKVLFEESNL